METCKILNLLKSSKWGILKSTVLLKSFKIFANLSGCIDVGCPPGSPIKAGGRLIIGACPLWLHLGAKKKLPGWTRWSKYKGSPHRGSMYPLTISTAQFITVRLQIWPLTLRPTIVCLKLENIYCSPF